MARMDGVGPVTLEQVRRFLGQTSCKVTVQPVIDPVDVSAVDCYEIPRRMKEAMFLRMPASCFPYAAGARRMDLGHTKPYLPTHWCTIVASAISDGLSMHLWCRRVTAFLT